MSWQGFDAAAGRYERWYETARGRRADRAERALLDWLFARLPGAQRVLEIGCGTGHFTRWASARGTSTIGLDRSPAMLREARRLGTEGPLLLADAHRLPLRDRAVDVSLLVTTLEFLEQPALALRESVRVAERGLVLLVLNRFSLGALSRRHGPQSHGSLLANALDCSPFWLKREIEEAAGTRLRAVHWRSTLLPRPFATLVTPLPCGDVLGVALELAAGPQRRS